jgi:hypothetical protein
MSDRGSTWLLKKSKLHVFTRFYIYQILTTFNKLKIMSELVHDYWKRLRLFTAFIDQHKLTAIVLDISHHRLFKPVGIMKDERDKRSFFKLPFANKCLHVVNLGNILHHKSVKSKNLPCFKYQSVPIFLVVYIKSR